MTQVAEAPAAAAQYVGGGVLRKEDPELVTGHARYVDNISLPGMLWVGIVRSPFAHARVNGVELSRAREMPGVIAAFSGEDLAGEWAAGLPCAWPIANRSFPDPTTEEPRARRGRGRGRRGRVRPNRPGPPPRGRAQARGGARTRGFRGQPVLHVGA